MQLTINKKRLADQIYKEYETAAIPLSECCQKYLGIKPETATKKFNEGKLPFVATRLSKTTIIVTPDDLAAFIIDSRKPYALELKNRQRVGMSQIEGLKSA